MTKPQNIIHLNEVMTPLSLSKKDENLLDHFKNILLSEKIYYPFQPVKHINQVFIENVDEELLKDFAIKTNSRKLILARLISISYQYLAKNKRDNDIDYFQLKKNWLNLIQICFCTRHYQYHPESLLNKIEEANQV